AIAEKIAANSPLAHAVGKKIINRGIERAEFAYSVEALTVLQSSPDTAGGIRAFLETRKPRFPGLDDHRPPLCQSLKRQTAWPTTHSIPQPPAPWPNWWLTCASARKKPGKWAAPRASPATAPPAACRCASASP